MGEETVDAGYGKNDWWPWWGQLLLALAAMVLAGILLIGLPLFIANLNFTEDRNQSNLDIWQTMITPLIGLTTMTISGIFVFMTFRIDRGARAEAIRTAQKVTEQYIERNIKKAVDEQLKAQFQEARIQTELKLNTSDQQIGARIDASDKQMDARTVAVDERIRERFEDADERIRERTAAADKRIEDRVTEAEERIRAQVNDAAGRVEALQENARRELNEFVARIERLIP